MFSFTRHSIFEKEFKALSKRHGHFLDKAIEAFERLCEKQFDSVSPVQVIGPGKLHIVVQYESYTIRKVELAVPTLRKNQSPRVWFALCGTSIYYLCIGAHGDNYSDNDMDRVAKERATDFFS